MKMIDLFAGIGGFSLAAHWMRFETVAFIENNEFCQKVLKKNFPGIPIFGDIHKFGEDEINEIKRTHQHIGIVTGGFPCQPFSNAGKRKGKHDDRYVWPEMLRVIETVKPRWVIGENVAGLKSMEDGRTLEGILIDLENIGYQTETFLIPACGVGAWHRRDRIWIVAHEEIKFKSQPKFKSYGQDDSYTQSTKCQQFGDTRSGRNGFTNLCKDVPNTGKPGLQGSKQCGNDEKKVGKRYESATRATTKCSSNGRGYWSTEPQLGRVAARISNRVDRLKGLGNAIVPQVALEIFKAIEKYEKQIEIWNYQNH